MHRELTRLAASGLVSVTRVGNQKHYRANRDSPVFAELQGLVRKTFGLAGRIRAAFVYGSIAKGADTARSNIDFMVLADGLSYEEVYDALQAAEVALHRPVNPNLTTVEEWTRKRAAGNPFIGKVAAQPKLFVIGSESDLARTEYRGHPHTGRATRPHRAEGARSRRGAR